MKGFKVIFRPPYFFSRDIPKFVSFSFDTSFYKSLKLINRGDEITDTGVHYIAESLRSATFLKSLKIRFEGSIP